VLAAAYRIRPTRADEQSVRTPPCRPGSGNSGGYRRYLSPLLVEISTGRHTERLVCPLDAAALKRFPSGPTLQSGSRGDPEIFDRAGNHAERWNSSFRLFGRADTVCHFTHSTVRPPVPSGGGGLGAGAAGPCRVRPPAKERQSGRRNIDMSSEIHLYRGSWSSAPSGNREFTIEAPDFTKFWWSSVVALSKGCPPCASNIPQLSSAARGGLERFWRGAR
jgi:hypothetical protein